jgi:integrase/recombinase XerD
MSETSIDQIVSMEVESFRAVLKSDKKSSGTVRQYTESLGQMLMHCGKPPEQLTIEDLQRFKEFLSDKYCENSMYYRVVAVNQYTERMLHRPDLWIRPPQMVKKTHFPLSEDEMRAIQKAADDTRMPLRNRALVDVLYYGALRCDEVSHLLLSSLDLNMNRLRVECGKGKNYEIVNLPPEGIDSLKAYIRKERKPASSTEQALFINKDGKRLAHNGVYRLTVELAHAAGVTKKVHPHLFRHTCATHMNAHGVPITQIQKHLRHKNITTTVRYISDTAEEIRDAVVSTFSRKELKGPMRPIPPDPAPMPAKPSDLAYAAPGALTHEDILRARLEGKIDTVTMESMLAHMDQGPAEQAPKISKVPALGYQ